MGRLPWLIVLGITILYVSANRKLTVLFLVVALAVVCTVAAPQGGNPQQKRQQRPQRNRQGGGQRRQPQRKQQAAAAAADDDQLPFYLDPNLTLSKLKEADVDDFLKSRKAVNTLARCFKSLENCSRNAAAVSLVSKYNYIMHISVSICTNTSESDFGIIFNINKLNIRTLYCHYSHNVNGCFLPRNLQIMTHWKTEASIR